MSILGDERNSRCTYKETKTKKLTKQDATVIQTVLGSLEYKFDDTEVE